MKIGIIIESIVIFILLSIICFHYYQHYKAKKTPKTKSSKKDINRPQFNTGDFLRSIKADNLETADADLKETPAKETREVNVTTTANEIKSQKSENKTKAPTNKKTTIKESMEFDLYIQNLRDGKIENSPKKPETKSAAKTTAAKKPATKTTTAKEPAAKTTTAAKKSAK